MLKTDLEWNRTIICWEKTAYPNHLPRAGTDRIKNNLNHMQKSPLPPTMYTDDVDFVFSTLLAIQNSLRLL